jgi:hypothetical protein
MKKHERELRKLVARHRAQIIRITGSGHVMIRRADGETVTAASTPSDYRALRNIETHLTRKVAA